MPLLRDDRRRSRSEKHNALRLFLLETREQAMADFKKQ
jgi:hypothetical protein